LQSGRPVLAQGRRLGHFQQSRQLSGVHRTCCQPSRKRQPLSRNPRCLYGPANDRPHVLVVHPKEPVNSVVRQAEIKFDDGIRHTGPRSARMAPQLVGRNNWPSESIAGATRTRRFSKTRGAEQKQGRRSGCHCSIVPLVGALYLPLGPARWVSCRPWQRIRAHPGSAPPWSPNLSRLFSPAV
jgi:hypothetical protein